MRLRETYFYCKVYESFRNDGLNPSNAYMFNFRHGVILS